VITLVFKPIFNSKSMSLCFNGLISPWEIKVSVYIVENTKVYKNKEFRKLVLIGVEKDGS